MSVEVLRPALVAKIRARELVDRDQRARLANGPKAPIIEIAMRRPLSSCRSCGNPIAEGMRALQVQLVHERAPPQVMATSSYYVHLVDCWAHPALRPLGYSGPEALFQEQRAERRARIEAKYGPPKYASKRRNLHPGAS